MKRLLAAAGRAAANAGINVPGGAGGAGGFLGGDEQQGQQHGAFDPNVPLAGRTIAVACSLDLDSDDGNDSPSTTLTLRVEEAIGSGGFSTIYRAREVGGDSKAVALKHVRTGGGNGNGNRNGNGGSNSGSDFDGRALEDVTAEVSAMRAAGRHPHLLPLRAVGYARDGAPCAAPSKKKDKDNNNNERPPDDAFIVTELCGESLADALRRGTNSNSSSSNAWHPG